MKRKRWLWIGLGALGVVVVGLLVGLNVARGKGGRGE